jgi:hypothetical protein
VFVREALRRHRASLEIPPLPGLPRQGRGRGGVATSCLVVLLLLCLVLGGLLF